jgi:hypothetical protein
LQLDPAEEDVPPQQCPTSPKLFAADLPDTDTTCAVREVALELCLTVVWCDFVPGGHAFASPTDPIAKRTIKAASIAAARRRKAPPACKLLALDPPIMAHHLMDAAELVSLMFGEYIDADQTMLGATFPSCRSAPWRGLMRNSCRRHGTRA